MHSKLIIIGAGPGGYETALLAAKKGVDVTLIEAGPVGGTCLNEGCIPTKSFCKNAEFFENLLDADVYGIDDLAYTFDFKMVVERKNRIVQQLREGVETLLKNPKINLVKGTARFVDDHTVEVSGEKYSADYIIIATGSVSSTLPIEGNDLEGVITSREILNIDKVPEHLCVIGGGVIGLEFASIFSSLGSEVTVVEYAKEILPRFDADLAKRLRQSLTKRGITIHVRSAVKAIKKDGKGLQVVYTKKDKEEVVECSKVLMAVGRKANVDSLNLSDIGLEFTPRGITIDENMRTNIPHIYAIGDVVGQMMLAHAAIFQGVRALNNIMGEKDDLRLDVIPAAVFTMPEVATVGLTEEECKEKGLNYKARKSFFRANGKAVCLNEPDGYCKLLVADDKIVGCHIYGAHASDLIQEVCAMITHNMTIQDLQSVIHTHPTLSEVIQTAAIS